MDSYVCLFWEGRFISAQGPFGIHGTKSAIALLEALRKETDLTLTSVSVPRVSPADIFKHPGIDEKQAWLAHEAIQSDLAVCTLAKKCEDDLKRNRAEAACEFFRESRAKANDAEAAAALDQALFDLAYDWNEGEADEAWQNGFDGDAWAFANDPHESVSQQEEAKSLLEMSKKCGGWFAWFEPTPDRDGAVAFVTIGEWLALLGEPACK